MIVMEGNRLRLGFCDCCAEPIYEDEDHYEFPNGYLVCDVDPQCLELFLKEHYKILGGISTSGPDE